MPVSSARAEGQAQQANVRECRCARTAEQERPVLVEHHAPQLFPSLAHRRLRATTGKRRAEQPRLWAQPSPYLQAQVVPSG